MVGQPVPMDVTFDRENFDEGLYLLSQSDIRAAVEMGALSSGREHFEAHGQHEGRMFRLPMANISDIRRDKLARLAPYLREDMPHEDNEGRLDYLSEELRAAMRIVDTTNISRNGYDQSTLDLIAEYGDGLVLDCGAGRRDAYHRNVINYEIVAYDTTDVIGVGEALPFKDETFDAVISIAVLEHVRDPFVCANEISRVLKPGGKLLCSVPFLQPEHGYPHHYFNATRQGIARLFEDNLTIDRVFVPYGAHPAFALEWFIRSWVHGLTEEARTAFLGMTIGEIIETGQHDMSLSLVGQLPNEKIEELACGFMLRAHKEQRL